MSPMQTSARRTTSVKPLDRLQRPSAGERLRERLSGAPTSETLLRRLLAMQAGSRTHLRWISVESAGELRLVDVDDVRYFKACAKYTRLVTASDEAIIRTSLRQLVRDLDPDAFWQIHRSTIVNVAAIARITRNANGHLIVHLRHHADTLIVGETFSNLFRRM